MPIKRLGSMRCSGSKIARLAIPPIASLRGRKTQSLQALIRERSRHETEPRPIQLNYGTVSPKSLGLKTGLSAQSNTRSDLAHVRRIGFWSKRAKRPQRFDPDSTR